MKFTLSWLKDHLETTATLDEIVEGLTMIGLEVEEVDDRKAYDPFVIARVVEARQHPDADRLRVLTVDIGEDKPLQVVCGAPNARTGLVGVLARPGDYVPGLDVTLSVGKIRGVESFGMMASERELLLSEEHDGIIDLPEDAPVGTKFAAYAHLDDPVIDIAITPDRADCLGVHGVARDLAALGLGRLKDAPSPAIRGEGACPVKVTLDFPEGESLCPAFGLRLVRGVKNAASPDWMQQRLRAIGLRPINALVDITNYITFDQGRPLHVFDLKKVAGDLVVRRAKDGETVLALDGKTYTLDASMCVIADDRGVESLAGVMGGEESGCDADTTDVLIESALWVPVNIAQTGRKLGIVTDARYRFERGVDPAQMLPGLERATKMVMDLCGGTPSENLVAGSPEIEDRVITFPWSEIKRLSGIEIAPREAKAILTRLGFWVVDGGDTAKVAVPSWRADVDGKADLVEEVMRIVGVDKVPLASSLGRDTVVRPVLTPIQRRTRTAKRALAGRGMVEAVTWSFVSQAQAEAFGGGAAALQLANPIAADLSTMRPSLLPGLLAAAQKNADRGFPDVALFEVGQVFADDTPEGQTISATGLRRGTAAMAGAGRHWIGNMPQVSVFNVKGDLFALLSDLGLDPASLQISRDAPAWYHPGRSGTVRRGRDVFGHFGELHPGLLEDLDVDGPIVAFEVTLDALPEAKKKASRARPPLNLSGLMPVRRDFAFLVKETVEAERLVKAARGADKALIADVKLFDRYRGDKIGADEVSLAIEVTLQPKDRTLTDEDLEAVSAKIVAAVEKATGASLRG